MSHPVYIVLGATGGIGSAVTKQLAPGAELVLAGRDREELHAVAHPLQAREHVLDAAVIEDVKRCVDRTVAELGRLDGIVNCVGSLLLKPAHLTKEEEWEEVLATNLRSAFATVRAAAPAMRKAGGSIVLISSAAARVGLANHEAIAAAKAGVIGLMLSAAATYASWGVRVNAVAPGLVRTPLSARITESEAMTKASEAMHALGRLGEPAEIASMIAWLLDREQSWVTGQVFGVDGGLSSVRPR
jgi:NAD(P)-dependent dehydrogenase (short-subunit alcohol dehydrogenase family)